MQSAYILHCLHPHAVMTRTLLAFCLCTHQACRVPFDICHRPWNLTRFSLHLCHGSKQSCLLAFPTEAEIQRHLLLQPRSSCTHSNMQLVQAASVCMCSYWGEPVKWGPSNKLPSAESCCAACREHQLSTPLDLECNGKRMTILIACMDGFSP